MYIVYTNQAIYGTSDGDDYETEITPKCAFSNLNKALEYAFSITQKDKTKRLDLDLQLYSGMAAIKTLPYNKPDTTASLPLNKLPDTVTCIRKNGDGSYILQNSGKEILAC